MSYITVDGRIVDVSVATYATDYFFALVCLVLYFGIPSYQALASQDKKKDDDAADESSSTRVQQAKNCYTYLGYAVLVQAFCAALGAVFHHQLYHHVVVFDIIGIVQIVASTYLIFALLSAFEYGAHKHINGINFKMTAIFLVSFNILYSMWFWIFVKMFANILGLFLAYSSQPLPQIKNNVNLGSLKLGCWVNTLLGFYYASIMGGCRDFHSGADLEAKCSWPAWFNHNAFSHVAVAVGFYFTLKGFAKK